MAASLPLAALADDFRRDGYLRLESVADADDLAEIRALLDPLFARFGTLDARHALDVTLRKARAKSDRDVVGLAIDSHSCATGVLIVNPTPDVRWAVVLEAHQTVGGVKHSHTFHIPYLPSSQEAFVQLPCVPDPMGSGSLGHVELSVHSAPNIDEAVRQMARTRLGNTLQLTITPGRDERTVLGAALSTADADVLDVERREASDVVDPGP
jgi:hypothetical protein